MSGARLPLIGADGGDETVAEVLAGFAREGREPIALYKVLANSPGMLAAMAGVGRGLRFAEATPRELRELMVLRVAQLTGSDYEWSHHKAMAQKLEIDPDKLAELASWRESERFDERERAVLACAEEVHEVALSAATFAELQRLFSAEAIIEIVLTAAHYQSVSRVIQGLGVEVEPDYKPYLANEEEKLEWSK